MVENAALFQGNWIACCFFKATGFFQGNWIAKLENEWQQMFIFPRQDKILMSFHGWCSWGWNGPIIRTHFKWVQGGPKNPL